MSPRTLSARLLRFTTLAVLALGTSAVAGIPTKSVRDSIVFRVAEDGTPIVAGKISVGEKVEIIGFRPDFEWVRIRYESDEGYVQKESLSDLDLPTGEYFDPTAEKLGRRGNNASYSLALLNARKRSAAKPAFSLLLSFQGDSSTGIGGAVMYRSFSMAPTGFDLGVEGLLYVSTLGTPFSLSAFYRYWMGAKIKLGIEALATATFVRVEGESGTGTETTSALGVGVLAGIPFREKFVITPGVRLSLADGGGFSYVLGGSWSL